MTLDGAFTNLEVTSTCWYALQWLHPADWHITRYEYECLSLSP